MSAAKALKAARAAGVHLGIDGDDLMLEASMPPPPGVLDGLKKFKTDIIALLTLEPNRAAAPKDFLKAIKRSGAELFAVGGRLALQGEFDPALHNELERHRDTLEGIVGTERLGGIAGGTAAATAAILAKFGTKTRLLTTIPVAAAAIRQLLAATGRDGVIGADIETTPLSSFAASRPPFIITTEGAISSKQPAWKNDAALDPYRAEVRVLSLWNPRGSTSS